MNKFKYILIGILLGVLISGLGSYLYYQMSVTIIYKAKEDIQLSTGILIPKGTRLMQIFDMPEGFETLALYIDVYGDPEDLFFKESKKPRGLVIPSDEYGGF